MTLFERFFAWLNSAPPSSTGAYLPEAPPEAVPPRIPSEPDVDDVADMLDDPEPTPIIEVTSAEGEPTRTASFDVSIVYILKNEGGFVNDPSDRGGATNYGITRATYQAFKGRPVSVAEIKAMPLADAKAIYKKSYWSPYLEQINQGVATAIFDWSVLHGTTNARKLAQQVANAYGSKLLIDGKIGPVTVEAINAVVPKVFVNKYALEIKAYFRRLVSARPSQVKFLNGWNNRADRIGKLV